MRMPRPSRVQPGQAPRRSPIKTPQSPRTDVTPATATAGPLTGQSLAPSLSVVTDVEDGSFRRYESDLVAARPAFAGLRTVDRLAVTNHIAVLEQVVGCG